MDIDRARAMARALMDEHGLTGWTLKFTTAKHQGGSCAFDKRTIRLSAPIIDLNDEATVRLIVLHEIAHALAGPEHGHGPVWKAKARSIGTVPRASLDYQAPVGAWQATCACPGRVFTRHRRTGRNVVLCCRSCRTPLHFRKEST